MPQTGAKNPWKYNPRLQPSENYLRTNNTNIILKNNLIEVEGIAESEEIQYSKIKRKNSFEWKILETKEEVEELKVTTENLAKISGQCIKIVTEDRPKPNIIFLRPKSMFEKSNVFSRESSNLNRFKTASLFSVKRKKKKSENSILDEFNPTKFNPREIKSSELSKRKPPKSPNRNENNLVINFGKGNYRPYTAGSFKTIAESQARSKRQLDVLHKERFDLCGFNNQKTDKLKKTQETNQELDFRVRKFCERIEEFNRETLLASEYFVEKPNDILFDNNLEKLLQKLNTK